MDMTISWSRSSETVFYFKPDHGPASMVIIARAGAPLWGLKYGQCGHEQVHGNEIGDA